MPGIFPRIKQFLTSGFGYIAFLMAQIYSMVRLLPPQHPYLDPKNIGHYGIRHVIAQAANNLVMSKKNIDQIIVFILMLTGVVLILVQLGAVLFSVIFGSAMALPTIFETVNPDNDIAFMLLDQVFGVGALQAGGTPFFNSCVSQEIRCFPTDINGRTFPWPFHYALQNLFRFYSLGILVIGTIIFLYFMMVIVVETATSGTPFGQRFQNVWVPIRLVMAVGLLIPLGFGYNAGQYITFMSAKLGSGMATNGWIAYNRGIETPGPGSTLTANNATGEDENLIAMPAQPDAAIFAQMMSIVHSCAFAHYLHNPLITQGSGTARNNSINVQFPENQFTAIWYYFNPKAVKPYYVKAESPWQTGGTVAEGFPLVPDPYQEALDFYSSGDIIIRFGRDDPNGYSNDEYTGKIEPTCGEIRIPISDRRKTTNTSMHIPGPGEDNAGYLGSVALQRFYFNLISRLWGGFGMSEDYIDFAGRMTMLSSPKDKSDNAHTPCEMGCAGPVGVNPGLPGGGCGAPDYRTSACARDPVTSLWKQRAIDKLQLEINTNFGNIWRNYNQGTNQFDTTAEMRDRGWGGAGIWFNTIAAVNGAFVASALDVPSLTTYPLLMEKVRAEKVGKDTGASGIELFNPNASIDGREVAIKELGPDAMPAAKSMYHVIEYWNQDSANMAHASKTTSAGAMEDAMNIIFGTYGLFAMTDDNENIHPLSQLVTLGKGLVESAVRNVTGASLASAMGGAAKAMDTSAGPLVQAASGFLMSTAFVGLTAGFVLYYVLPFLPFVYFYFAVASWLKTIFEAMVGVPLWALAHLRLDGDGLPGDSASNGYFLIFEIFIRPILTVAGLVAALLIFTAQVRILNFIWPIVTNSVGGFNTDPLATPALVADLAFKKPIIDQFFYTVIYAIIVYMLATTSFKLIDKIPDNLLRWMGQGVSSFGDLDQDPTQNLTRYAAMGGMTAGQQAAQGINQLAGGLGGGAGQILTGGGTSKIPGR